ncbi:MAG: hypothetical protein Q8O86_03330 [Dehalococcoidia bacterium]|nr:hypothetical protein [Dehalococcoidia bacterium]
MRAHVILPDDLVEGVDEFVGKRKRSRFVEDAVREKLKRERLGQALKSTAGMLGEADYPEWSTSEKVLEWVRKSREADEERARLLWERSEGG